MFKGQTSRLEPKVLEKRALSGVIGKLHASLPPPFYIPFYLTAGMHIGVSNGEFVVFLYYIGVSSDAFVFFSYHIGVSNDDIVVF